MKKSDIEALAKQVVSSVRDFVARAEVKFVERLERLESKFSTFQKGADGKDATDEQVLRVASPMLQEIVEKLTPALIADAVARAVAELPKPKDGESVTLEQVMERVLPELNALVAALPKPIDGKDVDYSLVKEMIAAATFEAVAALPKPKDGKDADPVDVDRVVAMVLEKIVPPKDGRDADPEQVRSVVAELLGEAIAALPKPRDGRDADPIDVDGVIASVLSKIQAPKDGKNADPAETRSIVAELVGEAVAALPKPKDGISVDIAEVRALVTTEVASLPKPKDGESVPLDVVQRMVNEAVAVALSTVKLPRDGEPGRDAAELSVLPSIDETKPYRRGTWASHRGGLIRATRETSEVKDGNLSAAGWDVVVEGLPSFDVVQSAEDPRVFETRATTTSGAVIVSSFRIPVIMYKGVWTDGEYNRGDFATHSGSVWHCQRDKTRDRPGTSDAWKLAVKEGARGKDGKNADDASNQQPANRKPVKVS